MIDIKTQLCSADLLPAIRQLWNVAAPKVQMLNTRTVESEQTPVFTIDGVYQPQGWTEWTQGFQFGTQILLFDATDDPSLLEMGRTNTFSRMASHVSHFGVHDHGFNNISTYGNLRRLAKSGRFEANEEEIAFYEMALKTSGAVQAARWSQTIDGDGYIYSFNGPHSLFCDTIRSLRSLSLAHQLNHDFMGENDERISLLDRMIQHANSTARYSVYYGKDRDAYDVRGRVAHESVFNCNDGRYRCPSTQQGYSPFSTWTRGLAWIMLGYPEQLEFIASLEDQALEPYGGRANIESMMLEAARASCDFFIENTPTCGVPYWDTGAPGLTQLGDYLSVRADPFNEHEPVDSSAAAIGCQGLLRLGRYLTNTGDSDGDRYWQAGLTTLQTLLEEPYLSTSDAHEGLLLHSVYHRPRNWDHVPADAKIPCGESCMWGDYHLVEAALFVQRIAQNENYSFYG